MLPPWVDRVAHHAYTLCLVLAAATLGLAPLHMLGVHRANVHQLRADTHAVLKVDPGHGLHPGDPVPMYRYNGGWTLPIGHGAVASVSDGEVVVELHPETFRWPPGRQGTVVAHDGDTITTNVGRELALSEGTDLVVFDGRDPVAKATITSVAEGRTTAQLREPASGDLVGHTATNFRVADQIAWFRGGWVTAAEVAVLAVALGLWAWSVVDPRPGSWLRGAAGAVRARWPTGRAAHLVQQSLLGVPVIYVFGSVLWYGATRLVHHTHAELYILGWVPDLGLPEHVEGALPVVWGLGAVAWYGWLFGTGRSPARDLWHALRWRPVSWRLPVPRGVVLWTLHLVIAWAFASTLFGVLSADLRALAGVWPPADLPSAFEAGRYLLWSATICGCLFGYGHTVLSILWTRSAIRHLDFTPMGWFTNALCYTPLLGAALLRTFPPLHGTDPILVGGPLSLLQPVSELTLNLCYTLSVWNLGKMFGVMVDKGVRTTGFYAVVRHPSYTLESLMFLVAYTAGASSILQWIAMSSYLLKYWLRSERDDQFMSAANADYTPYRDRVQHKYLPGIW